MEKMSDCWQTPDWLFEELNAEFNFDIDLCADGYNTKCLDFCEDYLNNIVSAQNTYQTWLLNLNNYRCAFMNPPYSNPKPFIEKAWEDSKHCKIVCLVKCDPSTRWWATFWNYTDIKYTKLVNEPDFGIGTEFVEMTRKAGSKRGCEIRFFPKRIQFDPPQQLIDSGEVWKVGNKWQRKCANEGCVDGISIDCPYSWKCPDCSGKAYTVLSGPTFPCALAIMDRRGLENERT